jgi:hypothetical protein
MKMPAGRKSKAAAMMPTSASTPAQQPKVATPYVEPLNEQEFMALTCHARLVGGIGPYALCAYGEPGLRSLACRRSKRRPMRSRRSMKTGCSPTCGGGGANALVLIAEDAVRVEVVKSGARR